MSRPRRGRTFTPAAATVLAVLALLVLAWLFAQPTGVTPRGTPYRDLPAFGIWAAVAAASMVVSVGMAVALWRTDPAWRAPDNEDQIREINDG